MRKLLLALALIATSTSGTAQTFNIENPGIAQWRVEQSNAMQAMEQRSIETVRAQQDQQNAPVIIPLPVYRPAPEYYRPEYTPPPVYVLPPVDVRARGDAEAAKQFEKNVPPTEFEFTPEGMKAKDCCKFIYK